MSGPLLKTTVYLPYDYAKGRVELIEELREIKTALNRKTTGEYYEQEVNTAQSVFGSPSNNKTVFRKVLDFGALPVSTTKTQLHGITFNENTKFLKIYATATDPVAKTALPIPFSSSDDAQEIKLFVTETNVEITTVQDYSSYTQTYVVLEYVKF